jgi:hypothetical protein
LPARNRDEGAASDFFYACAPHRPLKAGCTFCRPKPGTSPAPSLSWRRYPLTSARHHSFITNTLIEVINELRYMIMRQTCTSADKRYNEQHLSEQEAFFQAGYAFPGAPGLEMVLPTVIQEV